MPLRKLASSHAHIILSKMIDIGLVLDDAPITSSAKCEEHGFQVVVTIAKYAPMRIHPSVLAKIDALAERRENLTDVESCILEAAPTEKFVTIDRLAKLSGYANSQWFRESVDELILARLLIRTSKGIQRVA